MIGLDVEGKVSVSIDWMGNILFPVPVIKAPSISANFETGMVSSKTSKPNVSHKANVFFSNNTK